MTALPITVPPPTMRAWVFDRTGEPSEQLELRTISVPRIGPDQVLVRVRAASVNFSDALIVRGTYQLRPPLPAVVGMEVAGDVASGGDLPLGVMPRHVGRDPATTRSDL